LVIILEYFIGLAIKLALSTITHYSFMIKKFSLIIQGICYFIHLVILVYFIIMLFAICLM